MSSIGVTSCWDPCDGLVLEDIILNLHVAAYTGYVASKYVVQHVISLHPFHTTWFTNSTGPRKSTRLRHRLSTRLCLHMGQACGPQRSGAWGTTEWMPIMVKSSIALGASLRLEGVRQTSRSAS